MYSLSLILDSCCNISCPSKTLSLTAHCSLLQHPFQEGMLLGMGNPLLDISATVPPELLAKHKLKANNAVLTEDEAIFTELTENHPVDFIAGGATQNSIRVAQWILGLRHATSFIGCVGMDKYGETLSAKAKEDGVRVQYQVCLVISPYIMPGGVPNDRSPLSGDL